jgi:hypothetical protein
MVENNVKVAEVKESASAVRTGKIVREGPASGRGDFARDVFVVEFEREDGSRFSLTASEELVKGLNRGVEGNVTARLGKLKAFVRKEG